MTDTHISVPEFDRHILTMTPALVSVVEERARQDAKWGGPTHDDEHTMGDWALFLCEHLGHFVGMTLSTKSHPWDNSDLRGEALHVAAVALAIVESIDRAALAAEDAS